MDGQIEVWEEEVGTTTNLIVLIWSLPVFRHLILINATPFLVMIQFKEIPESLLHHLLLKDKICNPKEIEVCGASESSLN